MKVDKTVGRADIQFRPDEPHLPRGASATAGEEAYCTRCGAIYHAKHWHLDPERLKVLKADPSIPQLLCWSCKAIEEGDLHGEVHVALQGSKQGKEQLLNTILNEEARSRATNPHSRIAKIADEGDRLEIRTVTPFLAERIGKELKKAVHGSHVKLERLPRDAYIRVYWEP